MFTACPIPIMSVVRSRDSAGLRQSLILASKKEDPFADRQIEEPWWTTTSSFEGSSSSLETLLGVKVGLTKLKSDLPFSGLTYATLMRFFFISSSF